jgi:hypothetical protein
MKNAFIILSIVVVTFLSFNKQINHNEKTINPLLGDISFINKFGQQPTATTNEDLRIRTHLEYVENLLRQKDVSNLTVKEKENREYLLDFLHDYWTTGIFPRNYDYANKRVPCFIDKDGRICAVGYLIEKTAGRQVAEKINAQHKYEKLLTMNDPAVYSWVAKSGLTEKECAMIQPTYGQPPSYNYNYISQEYGITSALFGGTNLALSTINAIQISEGTDNKTIPTVGLITGAGSVVLGIINLPENGSQGFYNTTNESQQILSIVNIGLGLTTMILSGWNLIDNREPKDKSVSWNFFGFPTQGNQMGIGVHFTKQL